MTPRRVALVAGVVVLAAVAWVACLRVVPGDATLVRPEGGAAGPGIVWAPRWQPTRIVVRSGSTELASIRATTREGAELRFACSLEYTLGERLTAQLAGAIVDRGLDAALTEIAAAAVSATIAESGAEAVLANPARAEPALAAAFADAGLIVSGLGLTSDLTGTVIGRRQTERARELARPFGGRLLVIGLDGADWDLIRPLIAAGRLPHLARLVREGASADLRSLEPMYSPLLWTTIATGHTPDRHGVADFLVRDRETGTRRPITSDFRRVKALWNILGEFDLSSGWLSWWATYPAESIDGVMITEMLPSSLVRRGVDGTVEQAGLTWPPDWLASRTARLVTPADVPIETVRRLFPIEEPEYRDALSRVGELEDADDDEPADPAVFALKILSAQLTYHGLALDLLEGRLPVVAVYYEGIDMIGHRFQHYIPPRMAMVSDAEFRRYAGVVEAYYRLQDEMIGELLAAAGPDTTTLLVSDHGFLTGDKRPADLAPYTEGQPAQWHRRWGVFLLHGPGIAPGRLAPASLYDVAPTMLHVLGLPTASDMPGRVVTEAFVRGGDGVRAERVESYELVGRPLERDRDTQLDPEAMADMMANLRALGYVGGEDAPKAAGANGAPIGAGAAETQVFYHRNLATYHINAGDLAAAERELLRANEREPLPKTYALLSRVRAEQGRFDLAAAALREGLDRLPDQMSPETPLWLVELALLAGDAATAERAGNEWRPRATASIAAAIDGRLAEFRGERDGAVAAYERALAIDARLSGIALRLHAIYVAQGRPAAIEPVLRRGLAESRDGIEVYHNLLGEIVRARGELDEAIEHFERAVEVRPENGLYLGNLALAQAADGRRGDARRTLAWAERWSPTDPEPWLVFAGVWDRLGEPDAALAALATARSRGADGPRVEVANALILMRAGRTAEAGRVVAAARGRFPGVPALDDLARRLAGPR